MRERGGYNCSISGCPEWAWRGLMRGLTAVVAAFVLFFVVGHRHGIDAGEPAVEIDVGAAPRAERTKSFDGGFAADRAGAAWSFRHGNNMGRGRRRANGYGTLSQPKWIG